MKSQQFYLPFRCRYKIVAAFLSVSTLMVSPSISHGQEQNQIPLVFVTPVEMQDVNRSYRFLGRIEPIEQVDVRARVEGFLQERHFEEGKDVEAGSLLFNIEPEPYEAVLHEARAELTRARARLDEAERNFSRMQSLIGSQAISQANVDQAERDRNTAAAEVEAAQARVESAELNLSYTRIESAISGRIGRTRYTRGNLVSPESGSLARIVQLDPIRVVYSVADRDRLAAWRALQPQDLRSFEASFTPLIRLPNGELYPHDGRIEFTDNEVDPNTGTISVWAIFPNADGLLMPGHLVGVESRVDQPRRLPVVPQAAIQRDRQGQFVLVVNGENRVEERRIETGETLDDRVAVENGLEAGEQVITRGLQRVEPGATVRTRMLSS